MLAEEKRKGSFNVALRIAFGNYQKLPLEIKRNYLK
jgi:hypothetical protein